MALRRVFEDLHDAWLVMQRESMAYRNENTHEWTKLDGSQSACGTRPEEL